MTNDSPDKPKFTFGVPAVYRDPILPLYRGNPMIETLPNYYSPGEVLKQLAFYPPVDSNLQSLPVEVAIHFLRNFDQFFQPNGLHVALEQKISVAVHNGYITRNPRFRKYWPGSREFVGSNTFTPESEKHRGLNGKQNGMSLLAPTGMGKTVSVLRILQLLYEQVVIHTSFDHQFFYFTQIVWLYVQCPSDGSLKGLCFNILHAIDALIGGDHYVRYSRNGRASKDEMKGHIKNLSRKYGLGLLVLDEFANLVDAKWNDQQDVINFLIELDNMLALPILIIGTLKAYDLLNKDLQIARRQDGQGTAIWGRMERPNPQKGIDGKIWTTFIRELSKCQILPIKTKIYEDEALEVVLYEESQGIPDFVVKLFLFAQARALLKGQSSLTADLIRSVAVDSLQLARPFLNAVRKKDFEALKQVDVTLLQGVEAFVQKELTIYQTQEVPKTPEPETSEKTDKPEKTSTKSRAPGKGLKGKVAYSEGDLRVVTADAAKKKIAPHTALADAGHLLSILDAIPQVEKA